MEILFLITARGGSKGLPQKNIAKIKDIHLIGYKAIAAQKSNYCCRLMISTDCSIIAEVAQEYGVEVPFMRPAHLATDEANGMDVILHAMQWIEENEKRKYDAVCILQPTAPFATFNDINEAVELFVERDALGVISVKESKPNSIFISEIGDDLNMKKHYEKMLGVHHARRQDLKKEYTMNGAIYIGDWEYLKQSKTFHSPKTYGYIMPESRSVDIDDLTDLQYARFVIEEGLVDVKGWL